MSCEHWSQTDGYAKASLYAACPWCEITRLKGTLSLAEEGLANYQQDIAARDQALKDLGYQLGEAEQGLANYAQELGELREYLRDRLGNDYARLVEDIERRAQPQPEEHT